MRKASLFFQLAPKHDSFLQLAVTDAIIKLNFAIFYNRCFHLERMHGFKKYKMTVRIIYDLRPRTILKENAALNNGTRPKKSLQM